MTGFDYLHWLAAASRHTRVRSDAPDLLHDAILVAIRANRTDFHNEGTRRWFSGVLRNTAAMTAREAGRRRNRERLAPRPEESRDTLSPPVGFLDTLAPSARRVATLALGGMNRVEIMAALRLTGTAFRQRLTTIRRAWRKQCPSEPLQEPARDPELELGLVRQALIGHVRRLGGIGTHDPDGHLIVLENLTPSQSPGPRQRISEPKEKQPCPTPRKSARSSFRSKTSPAPKRSIAT
ncbi:MAG: RNA polymerase sigma factor [Tepidisphaeraceae bacterium]